jgi:dTMP kinase
MNKAPFIVIDGGEGAGKSTLILRLKQYFGQRVITTREPGGSPKAEEIRSYIFAHPELSPREVFDEFWAARKDHVIETIKPSLEKGLMVICDRFDSSTFAYQIYEKNHPELIDDFWKYRRDIVDEVAPNLYIYMDVDVETGLKRKLIQKDAQLNYLDHASVEDQKRRQVGFREFFKHVTHTIVDANKTEDEVFQKVVTILERMLN